MKRNIKILLSVSITLLILVSGTGGYFIQNLMKKVPEIKSVTFLVLGEPRLEWSVAANRGIPTLARNELPRLASRPYVRSACTPRAQKTVASSFVISSSSGIMVKTSGATGIRAKTTSWMMVSVPNGNGRMSRITW